MSISSEITRLQGAKADIKTAIEAKGVSVPSSAKIDAYDDYIDQITTGGGVTGPVVFFYDYEGTLLHSYTGDEIQALSALPSAADHSTDEVPLTFDEWNWTLAEIKNYNTSYPEATINVGALYRTTDDKIHYIIEIPEASPSIFSMSISVRGTSTIDWGDGETTSVTMSLTYTHNYSSPGRYHVSVSNVDYAQIYDQNDYTKAIIKTYLRECYLSNTSASYQYYSLSFERCYNLKKISLPASTYSFDLYVFRYCYNLRHINRPLVPSVSGVGNYEYSCCYNLKSISIPVSRSLYRGAFAYCYSLESITLPLGSTLPTECFYNCGKLSKVIMPSTYTELNDSAFDSCGIEKITLSSNLTLIGGGAFNRCVNLESIVIPSGVTTLYHDTFNKCYALKSVSMPGVTTIGNYTFKSCLSLKSIDTSNITTFGTGAFDECAALETIVFKEGITSPIGTSNCFSLKTLRYPSTTTAIDRIYNCYALTDFEIPQGVTTLGTSAFYGARISSYNIPSGVTKIPNYCFYENNVLTSLTIPQGITEIGNWALYGSINCRTLICYPTTPPVTQTYSINNGSNFDFIYVPYSADHSVLAAYQSATNWSNYASKMVEMPEPQS